MLYTINNQPFINFDNLNINYDLLFQEATNFMMYNPVSLLGSNGEQKRTTDDPQDMTHPNDIKFTEAEKKEYNRLDYANQVRYLKFKKRAFLPWNIYTLNELVQWDARQKPNEFFPHTKKVMPYFTKMIKSLPIFDTIGWARIYANEAFNFVHPHTDWSPSIKIDQFIFFNLDAKKIYLEDDGKRIYPTGKSLYFDTFNIHGTDPEPYHNFSIRVDGRFTREFLKTLTFSRYAKFH